MSADAKIKEGYFEKTKSSHTWSGIPIKQVYKPEDLKKIEYERDLGDPGEYPYTRGVYSNMYRGRLWSRRLITGCPTPALTNERFKLLLREGETAINMICDQPTQIGMDSDHPLAAGAVGCAGVPICTMNDMFTIMDGIPLNQISAMLTAATPIAFPSYLLLAKKMGIPFSELRGTGAVAPPTMSAPVCMYGGREWHFSSARGELGEFVAEMEWVAKNVPKWNPVNLNSYIIRETGVNAAQEMAFVLANAFDILRVAYDNGVDVDLIASKLSFTCSAMIDIFEEVAKFRAGRMIWAKTLKEKFGVKDPKAMRMKMHVNTGGSLMQRQQAINNIARGAYAALAAVLGGCQSMQIASYDEPIAIPTEEAATIALRTEQILAFETGVASVADPLGGSYYIENLTEKMREEIQNIINEIEEIGGLEKAVRNGWIDQQMEKAWMSYQNEIESKDKIVVGVNEFVIPEEEDLEVPVYDVDQNAVQQYVEDLKETKKTRSQSQVKKALEDLRRAAEKGDENLIPYKLECCEAGATTAELRGTIRIARGLPYDPMGVLDYPFK
ncbi:MAG: methylmalonyl-CoA mutase family protein [Thermodesulfobacteriota bacterium]|nr:methylmalonyl-CoA mutase family protein [Thermodesulfobacteriota bacterium]